MDAADQHDERICDESSDDSNVFDAHNRLSNFLLAIAGFYFCLPVDPAHGWYVCLPVFSGFEGFIQPVQSVAGCVG
jgi:hypothetical protein